MTIDSRNVLFANAIFSLCLIPINILAQGLLHVILLLPLVFFIPGYTFLTALFPGNKDLSMFTRMALSFGMSIAIIPLIGLATNYTPWGVNPDSVVIASVIFVCITSVAGYIRISRLQQPQRLYFNSQLQFPGIAGISKINKVLFVLLAVTILCALGCLGYALATPAKMEMFTEFYILGPEGRARNYPIEIEAGVPAQVTLGIINHESRPVIYRVVIKTDNKTIGQQLTGTLLDDEKKEITTSFTANATGKNQKVEFYLYRDNEPLPYFKDPLWLQVDITARR